MLLNMDILVSNTLLFDHDKHLKTKTKFDLISKKLRKILFDGVFIYETINEIN